ncbi:MAG: hypothetical protein GPJ21_03150 [Microcystis aeruginosa W13-11]|nr:hypothetical protein [Microcystis aeruginosa W13-11]
MIASPHPNRHSPKIDSPKTIAPPHHQKMIAPTHCQKAIAIPQKLLLPKTIAPPHHQKMIALQDQLLARRSH